MNQKISKNIKGGTRSGAGRKPGSPNKKTAELQAAIALSGITPLDYLLSVMRSPNSEPRARLSAAQAAAPYVHPKLSSIEVTGKDGEPLESKLTIEYVRPNPTA